MENKLQKIYLDLTFTSVFFDVVEKPLFRAFFGYMQTQGTGAEKRRAYAKFLSEIYLGGGSLTELVKRLVGEDENVYIKNAAKGNINDGNIQKAVESELRAFGEFAALSAKDFAEDMGLANVPAFSSERVQMSELYALRIQNLEKYGYGIFSSRGMFRLSDDKQIEPIVSADKVDMATFIGYEAERAKVVENTLAFVEGRPAANTLLCGDAGTGKSSTVKAVANEFFSRGVRLIELRKDQLSLLPYVMGKISENPLKFIIFIDDLSFNQNDDNFSMLKAALEGSASARSENSVIYATSNRRHIIKESFGERDGDDVHRNDTLQETLSLSERFGLTVLFSKPNKQLYLEIVKKLALRQKIQMDEKQLEIEAEAFALKKGSRSARCAEQFIQSLLR